MAEPQSTPNPPIEDGKWYLTMVDGVEAMIVTKRTALQAGTEAEALRQLASKQDARIKELLRQNKDLQSVNADLADRLDNLRRNHRAVIAAKVEQQMSDLGYLSTTPEG